MATSKNIANRTMAEQSKADKKAVKKHKSPDLKKMFGVVCFPRSTYYFNTEEKRNDFIQRKIPIGEKYVKIHNGKRITEVRTAEPVIEE